MYDKIHYKLKKKKLNAEENKEIKIKKKKKKNMGIKFEGRNKTERGQGTIFERITKPKDIT